MCRPLYEFVLYMSSAGLHPFSNDVGTSLAPLVIVTRSCMLCCGCCRRRCKGRGSDLVTPPPPQFITVSQRGGELLVHLQQHCAAIVLVHSASHSLLPVGLQGWAVPRACSRTASTSATVACMQRQTVSAAASSCMRGTPTAGSRETWQMGLLWRSKFCGAQRWQPCSSVTAISRVACICSIQLACQSVASCKAAV